MLASLGETFTLAGIGAFCAGIGSLATALESIRIARRQAKKEAEKEAEAEKEVQDEVAE
jgi:hypothetical protein